MSRNITLGTLASTGKVFTADLDIILRSNALVQANSGGGKSWLLRRMIEQTFNRVPQIIIDPEGEFSTLREKFDVVLVGKGGDTPADIRSAVLLAHKLLELGTSAVIDLFEMSKGMRPQWVAAFVQALVDAPKKLWRDLLLYVDEAHELAPEPGHGVRESVHENTCRHALIDFAAKGRKRGYGVVAATQRLGKLSKDFAAELKNVFIGQTFIDIDRERAAGNLGISKANKADFFRDVKNLQPGSFYVLGRALLLEPTLVGIGPVETEHPEAGHRQKAPPPPTAKIKHLLPQLADLPKEAEQAVKTTAELKARVAELERELAKKPAVTAAVEKVREKSVVSAAYLKRVETMAERLIKTEAAFTLDVKTVLDAYRDRLAQSQQVVVSELGSLRTVLGRVGQSSPLSGDVFKNVPNTGIHYGDVPRPPVGGNFNVPAGIPRTAPTGDHEHLPEKCQRMLGALMHGEATGLASMPFQHVAVIAGVAPSSGTTSNRKSTLTSGGYITVQGPNVQLTDKGRAYPINVPLPPTDPRELLDFWKRELPEKVAVMLETVVTKGRATNEDLAAATEMAMSGTFSNYKSELTRRGLMIKQGGSYVPAEVFTR